MNTAAAELEVPAEALRAAVHNQPDAALQLEPYIRAIAAPVAAAELRRQRADEAELRGAVFRHWQNMGHHAEGMMAMAWEGVGVVLNHLDERADELDPQEN